MSTILEYKMHEPTKRWNRFFGVQSDSNPDKTYTVCCQEFREVDSIEARNPRPTGNVIRRNWACSCPRWTRNASRPECKHIRRVKHELDFGYIQTGNAQQVPASLTKFAAKFENAFTAIELD